MSASMGNLSKITIKKRFVLIPSILFLLATTYFVASYTAVEATQKPEPKPIVLNANSKHKAPQKKPQPKTELAPKAVETPAEPIAQEPMKKPIEKLVQKPVQETKAAAKPKVTKEEVQKETEEKELSPKKVAKSKEKNIKKIMHPKSKGIWVNVWNYPDDVPKFIAKQKKSDIDTIYLQINRSTTDIFKHQKKLDQILEEAHKKDMKVIGWSYCYLNKNISLDAKKFIKPALYVSPEGHSLDGMAADIEENTAVWAIKKYTETIKAALPADYPLLAIVFAPKIKPRYPWKYIGENWDVLMPMAYWHGYKNRTIDDVFDFIKHTALELRRLTGKEDLKIHLITDGERTTAEEVAVSLKAAKKFKINSGISLYPEHLATDAILNVIKKH